MNKGVKFILFVLLGIVFVFALGYVTQYLWNWLMPKIFGLTTLTLLETFGLLLLAKILFGFGGKTGGGKGKNWRWKKKMFQRYESMTPEERQHFKNRLKEKWCKWEEKSSTATDNDLKA
ncbi:MAG: hypothetical protein O9302_00545 [Cyclobacteriaceae bacterium]|jgi:hypothetical protein|nr:hypothetical protein [Flammeovirgaceae bacterium]MCZ8021253.1 hypothetical protein [Cytophagales bacterium]MCZ8326519.1 hypothetical protein [Cyclobacteriaceae bacterium]